MKFSIVIPAYNAELYIKDAILSVLNNNYSNYEIIVINDGSTDKTESIVKNINDNRIKYYKIKNNGLSNARNTGVKFARGDYLLFLDSDDVIKPYLLTKLNEEISKYKASIISFSILKNGKKEDSLFDFTNLGGIEAFKLLVDSPYFQPAGGYCYNLKYYKKNKLSFIKNRIHEDFRLVPLAIYQANSVSAIPYYGYDYITSDNSITTSKNITKLIKRTNDMILNFDELVLLTDSKYLKSYFANALLSFSKVVPDSYLNTYIKELKKRKISKYLLSNNLKRVLKKLYVKLFLNHYIKGVRK